MTTATTRPTSPLGTPARRSRAWRPAPVWIGVVAALISFTGSWIPSYWSDEVATVRATSLTVSQLMAFVHHRDAVHALYYLAMHGWVAIFGASEASLRAPSAIAVGVTAACVAELGRRLHSPRAGVVAGALAAILPRLTYAGAEARSYALTAAIASAMTLLFVIAATAPRPRFVWLFVTYAALALVGTVLFVYLVFLVPAHVLLAALGRMDRRRWRWFAVSTAIALVAAAPFALAISRQRHQVAWLGTQPVLNAWTVLAEPWFDSSVAMTAVAAVVIAGCALRWRAVAWKPARRLLLAGAVWVAVPTVLLLVLNAVDGPLYTSRYLTFAAPGFALVLAALVVAIPVRRLAAAALIALIVAALPTVVAQRGPYAKNGGSDLRQVAETVRDHAHAGDAVVFEKSSIASADPRQSLYAYPADYAGLADVAVVTRFPATETFADRTLPASRLRSRLASHRVVWLVVSGITDDCATTSAGRSLGRFGFTTARAYPVHRTTVCELTR